MSRKRRQQLGFHPFVFKMEIRFPALQPRAFCPQPCPILLDAHDVPLALFAVFTLAAILPPSARVLYCAVHLITLETRVMQC